jgi:hypothetical protein
MISAGYRVQLLINAFYISCTLLQRFACSGLAARATPSQDKLLYVRFSRPSNLCNDESWLVHTFRACVKLILPVPFRDNSLHMHCNTSFLLFQFDNHTFLYI